MSDWFNAIQQKRQMGPISLDLTDQRNLVLEVEDLRTIVDGAVSKLASLVWASPSYKPDLLGFIDVFARHLTGNRKELAEIHNILAEALGYHKDAEDDLNSPCPGQYVTGEHTSETLAAEAATKIKRLKELRDTLGRCVDRENARIKELECELAARRQQCSCAYWPEHNKIMPTPNCPTHGVEALDAQTAKPGKKAELRREIEALRASCSCPFDNVYDCLIVNPICPTHGNEAHNKRDAERKALATLTYVRKYFMGSEHGNAI